MQEDKTNAQYMIPWNRLRLSRAVLTPNQYLSRFAFEIMHQYFPTVNVIHIVHDGSSAIRRFEGGGNPTTMDINFFQYLCKTNNVFSLVRLSTKGWDPLLARPPSCRAEETVYSIVNASAGDALCNAFWKSSEILNLGTAPTGKENRDCILLCMENQCVLEANHIGRIYEETDVRVFITHQIARLVIGTFATNNTAKYILFSTPSYKSFNRMVYTIPTISMYFAEEDVGKVFEENKPEDSPMIHIPTLHSIFSENSITYKLFSCLVNSHKQQKEVETHVICIAWAPHRNSKSEIKQ